MNLNRDYLITVDIKQAAVSTPSNMQFYITDIGTSNIFAQLVINESNSQLITKYAPVETARNFEITLRVIKPNNEPKEAKFVLLNELEAFFYIDLTEDYKDYIGEYQCELFVDGLVNEKPERITTSSFSYEVLPSIMNNLDEVIEGDPDYPILDELLDRIEGIDTDGFVTPDYVDSKIEAIELMPGPQGPQGPEGPAGKDGAQGEPGADGYTPVKGVDYFTEEDIDEALDGVVLEDNIDNIIDNYLGTPSGHDNISLASPFKMKARINSPIDIRTVVNTESDIMNIEYPYVGMIVYVRDTGKRYEVLTLAPKQVGLSAVQDASVGTYRELDYATTEYVDEAVANAGGDSYDDAELRDLIDSKADKDHTHDKYVTGDDLDKYATIDYVDEAVSKAGGVDTTNLVISNSLAVGENCTAGDYQVVHGKNPIPDYYNIYSHIVGNGDGIPSNAYTLDWDGNAWFAGDVKVGANNKVLATEEYVDSLIGDIEAALSAILGGEDTGGEDTGGDTGGGGWPTGGGGWPTGGGA